ncbi:MAG: cell filamentation protein Fic [Firmicutes bacterium HGW-Firmicutes-14]|jgi:Fic family protein|nr:MAG: cell filamentation protein Fic [Firmicutes bacterium HGW-Firmicutes-14]
MMSFRDGRLSKLNVPMGIVRLIGEINQYKGKQEMYRQQSPQILDALRQVAFIQSTESSNAIEGITIQANRLKQLMEEKTTPRDRPEGEIAGYRDVLATIHASYDAISITPGVIRQLHRDLYKFTPAQGGIWKPADNTIGELKPDGTQVVRFNPVPACLTPGAMDELCESFNREFAVQQIDPLVLTGVFVLDFLCVHPFFDGNGRMARLLTLLLLYKFDYEIGRYISLEKLIEKTKESYYDTLYASSLGWHEGEHNMFPWLEYFLGIILAAYREFGDRASNLETSKGSKSKRIKEVINHFTGEFAISDIERVCPDISRPTIYRVMKELKEEGFIKVIEIGRNARWKIQK